LVINNPLLAKPRAKFKIIIVYCIHYFWFEIKFWNISMFSLRLAIFYNFCIFWLVVF
jgi:hypothetical protein